MPKQSVEDFLADLKHQRKADIHRVRAIIRAADPKLTEQIKWNAPSYGYPGDDRITFRLKPADRVELIFHRGAKVRADDFTFADTSGLLQMLAPDRGIVSFTDETAIETNARALAGLVRAWMKATA